ncbi:MAG: 4Fe-4S binding protein [Clostridiales bacterium]|nr:4Fe-4S binding protein [Clostridiales bacterium]
MSVIEIDESKCNGCGLCQTACLEGAIGIVDGKAKLLREDFCDGLGNCLPVCPTGAIGFGGAAKENKEGVIVMEEPKSCPGSMGRILDRPVGDPASNKEQPGTSELRQWPVQIKLVSPNAACFDKAALLVSADCAAYACAGFHSRFMRGKVTIIGCPKLDDVDYSEKLSEIISRNDIKSLSIVRMEVPCCGGIERAAVEALKKSGKFIPWGVTVIGIDGEILE